MSEVTPLTDQYFVVNFNTKLSPEEESAFQVWAAQNGRANDVEDYDIRGAWRELAAGAMEEADNGHLGDKYKKPNHPTFSDQSVYHNTEAPHGKWVGGRWGEDEEGPTYTPSAEMLKTTHPVGFLQSYMQEREPDVRLNMDNTPVLDIERARLVRMRGQ